MRSRLASLLELEGFEHWHFPFNEGIVFVVKEKGREFERQVDVVLNRMARNTEHFLSVQVDIGVSDMHKDFRQLRDAYEEAGKALSHSRFSAVSHVSYFSQAGTRGTRPVSLHESDAASLEHALRYGSEDQVRDLLAAIKAEAEEELDGSGNLNLYVLNLVSLLANYAAASDIDLNELAEVDIIDMMTRMHSLDQLFSWISGVAVRIRERSIVCKSNNAQRLLESAVNLMRKDFADPELTMDSVCDRLGMSASYLGQLFRKYNQTSFVKFLTGVRIEKAKELLSSTGDRIVEIALQCGYRDVYYFSHSFKKVSGASPKKYREDHA